jgi:uncharacterized protein (DUF1501 family)
MPWTRRDLLRAGATTAATALLAPSVLLRPSTARAAGAEPVLVVVFLRGGADWLSLVPPVGDSRYYSHRPDLAVPRGSALGLGGIFGLHPELRPLLGHYRDGRLAVLQAFGSPHSTRSHFEAQDFLESAVPGNKTIETGWLGRYAAAARLRDPWSALTLGSRPARALEGATTSLAFPSIEQYDLGDAWSPARRTTMQRMLAAGSGEWEQSGRNAFAALREILDVDVRPRVSWPNDDFAVALRDLSLLIRSRIGVRVASVDMNGWDHHFDLPSRLAESAAILAEGLDAFVSDLGSEISRTVVLVLTEFGRSVLENGSGGTEHGRGGALLALGGSVRGGRVLLRNGQWPGLASSQLFEGRDLAVTTDFRDAFSEVLRRHMGVSDLGKIFPSFSPSTSRFPGLLG